MIGIINYGSGNLSAFVNVFKSLEKKIIVINEPVELRQCSHIIMPGVSAWDTTMQSVKDFKDTLLSCVMDKKIPFLGVCVGMQILASSSEEGTCEGLGWIEGKVKKLPMEMIPESANLVGPKLPHMGWNTIRNERNTKLMAGLPESQEYYFLHSYYFDSLNSDNVISTAKHNFFDFPVIIQRENIFGVQFHPEKSHVNGRKLLENFSKL